MTLFLIEKRPIYYYSFITEKPPKDICASINVTAYLTHLKLGEYVELFEEEGVDGKMLWEMCHAEEDELSDLGVSNAFHRRKIKTKLEKYLQMKCT